MNLIDEFVKVIDPFCDSPPLFKKCGGTYLVSSLLGRFFESTWLPKGRPNTWTILSSLPGITRRTSIENYVNHVRERVLTKYFTALHNTGELTFVPKDETPDYDRIIAQTSIEAGTAEGIMDHITEYNHHKQFDIISSEFGGVLKQMQNKQYFSGVDILLSKMYYGEAGTVLLSKRKDKRNRYIPRGLYVPMFTGMQEPKLYINKTMVRQGLLRRLMIAYLPVGQIKKYLFDDDKWLSPINPIRKVVYQKLDIFADKMFKTMLEYKKLSDSLGGNIDIHFVGGTHEEIAKTAKKHDKELCDNATDLEIYQQGTWEHLSKLLMCRAIGEVPSRLKMADGKQTLFVTDDDLKPSWSILKPITDIGAEVVKVVSREDGTVPTYDDDVEKTMSHIRKAGATGIARKLLYRKFGNISSDELDRLIKILVGQGRIVIERIPTGSTGTVPTVYKSTEFTGGSP